MPARLKSFELHGYKTFASRSVFQFSDGITAIVGPNGSGKSNISDALRWVLGEQSFGLLRAKKTEDMIFSGSENRSRSGMASATIVFDNSDGWLPIDFAEVGITRRAYRDGENEYLLNGQRVRLKDVSEVLAKSGLAERTYTIIGQGLVDAALALRAEERRRLFEEAAGIGLHRARREEALKRLDTTRRNMERVQDILAELQPRLRSLERQAKRVQEYDQKREELKVVLREWYGYHWHKAQSELVISQETAKLEEEALSRTQVGQHELDLKLNDYRLKINQIREALNSWHKELTVLHQRREILSKEQAINGERARLLLIQLDQQAKEQAKGEEEVGIQDDQLENSNKEILQLEQDLRDAQQSAAETVEALNVRLKERAVVDNDIDIIQQNLNQLTTQLTHQGAQLSEKEHHITLLKDGIQKIEREITNKEIELSTAKNKTKTIILDKEDKTKITEAVNIDLLLVQEKLAASKHDREVLSENLSVQKTRIAQLQAELNVLGEAEKDLIGLNEGTRILLQAMKDKRITGATGSLGTSITVPEEYETAIAAVMGEYIDAVILESIHQSETALDLIEGERTRGSLFPLDVIMPSKPLSLDLEKAPVQPENIIGLASKLVIADEKLKPIIDLLFGHVILVKDRDTARKIIASRNWQDIPNFRVVTLKGEMYLVGGPIITGGSGKAILSRQRQLGEIQKELGPAKILLSETEQQSEVAEKEINQLEGKEKAISVKYRNALELENSVISELGRAELQVDKVQHDLAWDIDQKNRYKVDLDSETLELDNLRKNILQLNDELNRVKGDLENKRREVDSLPLEELQAQNSYWYTNIAVIEQALMDSRNRYQEKINRKKDVQKALAEIITRSNQLDSEIKILKENMGLCSGEELQIAEKIEEFSNIVDPYEDQLNLLEREQTGIISTNTEARQQLRIVEQRYTQAKINLAHHQDSFESIQRHIEDDFGLVAFDYSDSISGSKPLPLHGIVEELPKIEILSEDMEESIRQQKAQIRRMGAINPEAQVEFKEVKERFEFLTSQVNDLLQAEIDIKEVITELDMLMEREFKNTFDSVAQEFKQIFTRLFGGGSARLTLTDPESIKDTGIDIEARLPGRREQGLSLLSGGERSLTAAALIFSLLRVSPTPFCILDEVDAMLDEANVGRFRDLLSELSEKTQFIVITHNRSTVQAASIIYGVTMGRDSASQVISLKMDELGEEFGV